LNARITSRQQHKGVRIWWRSEAQQQWHEFCRTLAIPIRRICSRLAGADKHKRQEERNKKRETQTHTRKFPTRVFCSRTRGPEEHSVELSSVLCGNRWRILRPRIRRSKRRSQKALRRWCYGL
jgi:hypothetical protein